VKAEYFQAIEETFLQCTGRGLSISEADRTHIEHWFDAGIPLQVVQHALIDSCGDREQKVRTIGFARKAVEKEFTAWREKRIGRAATPIKEADDALGIVDVLSMTLRTMAEKAEKDSLRTVFENTLNSVTDIGAGAQSKAIQYESVLQLEVQMYDDLWLQLGDEQREVLDRAVSDQISKERFLNRSMEAVHRRTQRQKKLRDHFGLVSFDQLSRGQG
jgi:hypothetical protein